MNVDDLLRLIGELTVENYLLRKAIAEAQGRPTNAPNEQEERDAED